MNNRRNVSEQGKSQRYDGWDLLIPAGADLGIVGDGIAEPTKIPITPTAKTVQTVAECGSAIAPAAVCAGEATGGILGAVCSIIAGICEGCS